ncbi:uncharacterized protein LOC121387041 [Gigantopelta aegis]|uniref:uncharacterized protein LOC121387041 n=1 Tax=Gigantopelta aegis TaxID=1735272 RepID=UPI001B88B3B7|nr:uncharacterized protein LOC121387041 [Gigantopelta aegis]
MQTDRQRTNDMVTIRKGSRIRYLIQNPLYTMTDILKLHGSWIPVFVCLGLLVTSMFCTICERQFMESSKPVVADKYVTFLPLFLSLAELLSCLFTFVAKSSQGEVTHKEAVSILTCAHFGGTLLTNILHRNSQIESTIAAGYTEALLTMVLVLYCRGYFENYKKASYVFILVFGAIGATISYPNALTINKLSLLKVSSLCFIILRNICCKHLHEEYTVVKYRSVLTLTFATLNFMLVGLLLVIYLSQKWIVVVGWLFCACVCHVTCTYLVSVYLLKRFSVTTVAVLGVSMQLLRNVFLVTSSARPDVIVELAAMMVVIASLLLYIRESLENHLPETKTVHTNEMYTRMEFLLFLLSIFGVIVCVLQPRLSQRDLDSLSYIGLV